MKFTLNIPIDHVAPAGEFQTLAALREMATALERHAIDACYLTDHPAPLAHWLHNDPTGHDAVDPFTAFGLVAALTDRLKFTTLVTVLPYRNPFLTAKAAATLQVFSNNRFILGVGAGYQAGEFAALGVPMNKRGALMDEALETMRMAWAGGSVVKKGMAFDAVGNEPRPAPSVPPTIWIGGGSDKAVERAAKWGDGWVPFLALPTNDENVKASAVAGLDALAEKYARLRELRAKLGKTGPFDLCIRVNSPLKGRSAAEADAFLAEVDTLTAIGVNWGSVELPVTSRADYLDTLQWFAEEVLPQVKR